jgi:translation initiation factor IF-2
MPKQDSIAEVRPPVVAIVGHIDHGKSTLLDYIRRTSVTQKEAGGITQHLSAYEAVHKTQNGVERTITFLDTPGHEAFASMRSRGLEVADVAVLVVSAEDGVKPQTLEALKLIDEVKIPYLVALTKIDKPGANLERARASLLEHGIYLEGLGGAVPHVALSSKTGEGVSELLDLILLAADLEGLSADPEKPGSGVVIEAHVDNRRGTSATLIVEDGSIESGEFVVAADSFAPTRIMENFMGTPLKRALPGRPVQIVGFSALPPIGAQFKTVESKKEAEEEARLAALASRPKSAPVVDKKEEKKEEEEKMRVIVPLIIKTDAAGVADAVVHELEKLPKDERLEIRVVSRGVGAITDGDVKLGIGTTPGIVVGFNVKVEREARDLAQRHNVSVEVFDVIYKLAQWLREEVEKRRPKEKQEERTGLARIVKLFSSTKNRVVLGGRVEEGELTVGAEVKILRRDLELGRGEVVSLQSGKTPVKKIEAGSEFGAMIKTGVDPAPSDKLEAFAVVYR